MSLFFYFLGRVADLNDHDAVPSCKCVCVCELELGGDVRVFPDLKPRQSISAFSIPLNLCVCF